MLCNRRYVLTGVEPKPLENMKMYQDGEFYNVISGNLFDGDKSYSMVGFTDDVIVS